MQNVFATVTQLEAHAHNAFGLTEDIMIENAAAALEKEVRATGATCVLIICGSGNNGSDGYALARRIMGAISCNVYAPCEPKTENCKQQRALAKAVGVHAIRRATFLKMIHERTVIVDCLYGTGFHGTLDAQTAQLFLKINSTPCTRIACDIPSGIDSRGAILTTYKNKAIAFNAHTTVAMGALKAAYFSDIAKDFCGHIVKANIGVSAALFENCSSLPDAQLLSCRDMHLPVREKKSVHKGAFGHAAIVAGEKSGAAIIAGEAALAFGTGLVTLVETTQSSTARFKMPPELMSAKMFPKNTTAVLLGSGFGRVQYNAAEELLAWISLHKDVRIVLDADMFYYEKISSLLKRFSQRVVLTPHPKEFQSLLKLCSFGSHSVETLVENRLEFVKKFSAQFPKAVLVLKGANTFISCGSGVFISTEGNQCLAKAGSGDVLAGLICALLAQNYSTQEAAITAVLAHGCASQPFAKSYAISPHKLIREIEKLSI